MMPPQDPLAPTDDAPEVPDAPEAPEVPEAPRDPYAGTFFNQGEDDLEEDSPLRGLGLRTYSAELLRSRSGGSPYGTDQEVMDAWAERQGVSTEEYLIKAEAAGVDIPAWNDLLDEAGSYDKAFDAARERNARAFQTADRRRLADTIENQQTAIDDALVARGKGSAYGTQGRDLGEFAPDDLDQAKYIYSEEATWFPGAEAEDTRSEVSQRGERGHRVAAAYVQSFLGPDGQMADGILEIDTIQHTLAGAERWVNGMVEKRMSKSNLAIGTPAYDTAVRRQKYRAVREIAMMKSVGMWTGPALLPQNFWDTDYISPAETPLRGEGRSVPTSLREALNPTIEIIGVGNSDGGVPPVVVRQQSKTSYLFDIIDTPLQAATGVFRKLLGSEAYEDLGWMDSIKTAISRRDNPLDYSLESEMFKSGMAQAQRGETFVERSIGGLKVAPILGLGLGFSIFTPDATDVIRGAGKLTRASATRFGRYSRVADGHLSEIINGYGDAIRHLDADDHVAAVESLRQIGVSESALRSVGRGRVSDFLDFEDSEVMNQLAKEYPDLLLTASDEHLKAARSVKGGAGARLSSVPPYVRARVSTVKGQQFVDYPEKFGFAEHLEELLKARGFKFSREAADGSEMLSVVPMTAAERILSRMPDLRRNLRFTKVAETLKNLSTDAVAGKLKGELKGKAVKLDAQVGKRLRTFISNLESDANRRELLLDPESWFGAQRAALRKAIPGEFDKGKNPRKQFVTELLKMRQQAVKVKSAAEDLKDLKKVDDAAQLGIQSLRAALESRMMAAILTRHAHKNSQRATGDLTKLGADQLKKVETEVGKSFDRLLQVTGTERVARDRAIRAIRASRMSAPAQSFLDRLMTDLGLDRDQAVEAALGAEMYASAFSRKTGRPASDWWELNQIKLQRLVDENAPMRPADPSTSGLRYERREEFDLTTEFDNLSQFALLILKESHPNMKLYQIGFRLDPSGRKPVYGLIDEEAAARQHPDATFGELRDGHIEPRSLIVAFQRDQRKPVEIPFSGSQTLSTPPRDLPTAKLPELDPKDVPEFVELPPVDRELIDRRFRELIDGKTDSEVNNPAAGLPAGTDQMTSQELLDYVLGSSEFMRRQDGRHGFQLKSVLRGLSSHSPNTSARHLARLLDSLVDERTLLNFYRPGRSGSSAASSPPRSLSRHVGAYGAFIPDDNELFLRVNTSSQFKLTGGLDEQTLLHESVHAATSRVFDRYYRDPAQSGLNESVKQSIKDLEDLCEKTVDVLKAKQKRLEADVAAGKRGLGLTEQINKIHVTINRLEKLPNGAAVGPNVYEFLAYGLTDPTTQSLLREIRFEGEALDATKLSFFGRFVQILTNIVSKGDPVPGTESALNSLLKLSDDLFLGMKKSGATQRDLPFSPGHSRRRGMSFDPMFIGERGATALSASPLRSVSATLSPSEAKRLISEGMSPEQARQQTGWFKRVDGVWRYEISDRDAKLIVDPRALEATPKGAPSPMTIGQLLDHPKLYAAYPGAANLEVRFAPREEGSYISHSEGKISLGLGLELGDDFLGDVLHELQHFIQNIEGMALGGSPKGMSDLDPAVEEAIAYTVREAKKKRIAAAAAEGEAPPSDAALGEIEERVRINAYRRLLGEVEADDTASRREMNAVDRAQNQPKERRPPKEGKEQSSLIVQDRVTEGGQVVRGVFEDTFTPDRIVTTFRNSGRRQAQTLRSEDLLAMLADLIASSRKGAEQALELARSVGDTAHIPFLEMMTKVERKKRSGHISAGAVDDVDLGNYLGNIVASPGAIDSPEKWDQFVSCLTGFLNYRNLTTPDPEKVVSEVFPRGLDVQRSERSDVFRRARDAARQMGDPGQLRAELTRLHHILMGDMPLDRPRLVGEAKDKREAQESQRFSEALDAYIKGWNRRNPLMKIQRVFDSNSIEFVGVLNETVNFRNPDVDKDLASSIVRLLDEDISTNAEIIARYPDIQLRFGYPDRYTYGFSYIARRADDFNMGDLFDPVATVRIPFDEAVRENYRKAVTRLIAEKRSRLEDVERSMQRGLSPQDENLKEFLGGSKVRVPVYHGTIFDFDVFETKKELLRSEALDQAIGSHVSVDASVAEFFKKGGYFSQSSSGTNHQLHLRMENPRVIDQSLPGWSGVFNDSLSIATDICRVVFNDAKEGKDLFLEFFRNRYNLLDSDGQAEAAWNTLSAGKRLRTEDGFTSAMASGVQTSPGDYVADFDPQLSLLIGINRSEAVQIYRRELKAQGYDGIQYQNTASREIAGSADNTCYIILDPNQVKSVQFNNGEYSLSDPSINRSVRSSDPPASDSIREKMRELVMAGQAQQVIELSKALGLPVDFSDAKMLGANFRNADLVGANFQSANLAQSNFIAADISRADFKKADLTSVRFDESKLVGADFEGANLGGADFRLADLEGANLRDADLREAELRESTLMGANLRDADLTGAGLVDALLEGADLRRADLRAADLSRANLDDVDLRAARYDKTTRWPEDFDYQNSGAVGPGANLRSADLSGADLSKAKLHRANLTGADLRDVDLNEADLSGADLSGANLSGAYLGHADLSGVDLDGVYYNDNTVWPRGFKPPASASEPSALVPTSNIDPVPSYLRESLVDLVKSGQADKALELARMLGVPFDLRSVTTDTPKFKRWFGESKVVGEDGKPLVMYHGTARTGQRVFATYGTRYGLMGTGAYFTADPTVASGYAETGRKKALRAGEVPAPNILPVYLSIKNPIDMDAPAKVGQWLKTVDGMRDAEDAIEDLRKLADGATNEDALRVVEDALQYAEVSSFEAEDTIRAIFERMGFDGLTHLGGGRVGDARHRVFVAFEPTQIKSATGNRGTFSPTDPRINFSYSGRLPDEEAVRGERTVRITDLMEVGTNITDADVYLNRKGTQASLGAVLKERKPGAIGLKLTEEGKKYLDPRYLNYFLQYLHGQGHWKPFARGSLKLQHITLDDIKSLSFTLPESPINFSYSGRDGDTVGTPEFERWFGDSKIVDGEGQPIVVYHGGADIEGGSGIFRSSRRGALGAGIYFTPDHQRAQGYMIDFAEAGHDDATTTAVYVSMKRPLEIRASKGEHPVVAAMVRLGSDRDRAVLAVEREEERYGYVGSTLKNMARRAGHDGIIHYNDAGEVLEIVAFEPTQIKSATGNRGTFDPADPRINFSYSGQVTNDLRRRLLELSQSTNPAEAQVAVDLARRAGVSLGYDGPPRFDPSSRRGRSLERWFGYSVVSDGAGRPRRMIHTTNAPLFDEFRTSGLSAHFGTVQAAADRQRDLMEFSAQVGRDPGTFRNIEVYLRVESPLEMPDLAGLYQTQRGEILTRDEAMSRLDEFDQADSDNPELPSPMSWESDTDFQEWLYQNDIIDREEFFEVQYDKDAAVALLKEKDYDGIEYINEVESPGSVSYIVFDAEQAKHADVNITYNPGQSNMFLSQGMSDEVGLDFGGKMARLLLTGDGKHARSAVELWRSMGPDAATPLAKGMARYIRDDYEKKSEYFGDLADRLYTALANDNYPAAAKILSEDPSLELGLPVSVEASRQRAANVDQLREALSTSRDPEVRGLAVFALFPAEASERERKWRSALGLFDAKRAEMTKLGRQDGKNYRKMWARLGRVRFRALKKSASGTIVRPTQVVVRGLDDIVSALGRVKVYDVETLRKLTDLEDARYERSRTRPDRLDSVTQHIRADAVPTANVKSVTDVTPLDSEGQKNPNERVVEIEFDRAFPEDEVARRLALNEVWNFVTDLTGEMAFSAKPRRVAKPKIIPGEAGEGATTVRVEIVPPFDYYGRVDAPLIETPDFSTAPTVDGLVDTVYNYLRADAVDAEMASDILRLTQGQPDVLEGLLLRFRQDAATTRKVLDQAVEAYRGEPNEATAKKLLTNMGVYGKAKANSTGDDFFSQLMIAATEKAHEQARETLPMLARLAAVADTPRLRRYADNIYAEASIPQPPTFPPLKYQGASTRALRAMLEAYNAEVRVLTDSTNFARAVQAEPVSAEKALEALGVDFRDQEETGRKIITLALDTSREPGEARDYAVSLWRMLGETNPSFSQGMVNELSDRAFKLVDQVTESRDHLRAIYAAGGDYFDQLAKINSLEADYPDLSVSKGARATVTNLSEWLTLVQVSGFSEVRDAASVALQALRDTLDEGSRVVRPEGSPMAANHLFLPSPSADDDIWDFKISTTQNQSVITQKLKGAAVSIQGSDEVLFTFPRESLAFKFATDAIDRLALTVTLETESAQRADEIRSLIQDNDHSVRLSDGTIVPISLFSSRAYYPTISPANTVELSVFGPESITNTYFMRSDALEVPDFSSGGYTANRNYGRKIAELYLSAHGEHADEVMAAMGSVDGVARGMVDYIFDMHYPEGYPELVDLVGQYASVFRRQATGTSEPETLKFLAKRIEQAVAGMTPRQTTNDAQDLLVSIHRATADSDLRHELGRFLRLDDDMRRIQTDFERNSKEGSGFSGAYIPGFGDTLKRIQGLRTPRGWASIGGPAGMNRLASQYGRTPDLDFPTPAVSVEALTSQLKDNADSITARYGAHDVVTDPDRNFVDIVFRDPAAVYDKFMRRAQGIAGKGTPAAQFQDVLDFFAPTGLIQSVEGGVGLTGIVVSTRGNGLSIRGEPISIRLTREGMGRQLRADFSESPNFDPLIKNLREHAQEATAGGAASDSFVKLNEYLQTVSGDVAGAIADQAEKDLTAWSKWLDEVAKEQGGAAQPLSPKRLEELADLPDGGLMQMAHHARVSDFGQDPQSNYRRRQNDIARYSQDRSDPSPPPLRPQKTQAATAPRIVRQRGDAGKVIARTEFAQDGKITIATLTDPKANFKTVMRGLASIARRELSNSDMDTLVSWCNRMMVGNLPRGRGNRRVVPKLTGHKNGAFVGNEESVDAAEQFFAEAVVLTIRDENYKPRPRLAKVFERFRTAMGDVDDVAKGFNIEVSEPVRKILDQAFTGDVKEPSVLARISRILDRRIKRQENSRGNVAATILQAAKRAQAEIIVGKVTQGIRGNGRAGAVGPKKIENMDDLQQAITEMAADPELVIFLKAQGNDSPVPILEDLLPPKEGDPGRYFLDRTDLAEIQGQLDLRTNMERDRSPYGVATTAVQHATTKEESPTDVVLQRLAGDDEQTAKAWGRKFGTLFFGGDSLLEDGLRLLPPEARKAVLAGTRLVEQAFGEAIRLVRDQDRVKLNKYLGGEVISFTEGREVLSSGYNMFDGVVSGLRRFFGENENFVDGKAGQILQDFSNVTKNARAEGRRFPGKDIALRGNEVAKLKSRMATLIAAITEGAGQTSRPLFVQQVLQAVMGTKTDPRDMMFLEALAYYSGTTQRLDADDTLATVDAAFEGLTTTDKVAAFLDEVEHLYDAGKRARVAVLIAGHGQSRRALDTWSGLGVTVDQETYEAFQNWVGGAGIPDPELRAKVAKLADRVGLNAKFDTEQGFYDLGGQANVYVPKAARARMASALQRGNLLDSNQLWYSADTDPSGVLGWLYRYMKKRMTRGNFVLRQRYFTMNAIDHFMQLGMTPGAGFETAMRSSSRLLLQQVMVSPGVAKAFGLLQKADLFSKEGRGIMTRLRRKLSDYGDAVANFLSGSKWRIEVNKVMEANNETVNLGGRVYAYHDIRQIAVEEGIFSSFDTSQLAASVKREFEHHQRILKREAEAGRLGKAAGTVQDSILWIQQNVEDTAEAWGERERIGAMVTLIEQGYDPRTAARITIDALYDYAGSMSKGDRHFIVNIMLPFWAFQKNANRAIFNNLFSPVGGYKMGVLRRAQEYGTEALTELAYASVYDPYGVDTESLPEEMRQTYFGLRKVIEFGYGEIDGMQTTSEGRELLASLLRGYGHSVENMDDLETANIDELLTDDQIDFIENGYGGPGYVPEDVRMLLSAIFSSSPRMLDKGRLYTLSADMLSPAGPQINMLYGLKLQNLPSFTMPSPSKSGQASYRTDRPSLRVSPRMTEEVREFYQHDSLVNGGHTYLELFMPESTVFAGMKWLTNMVTLPAMGASNLIRLFGQAVADQDDDADLGPDGEVPSSWKELDPDYLGGFKHTANNLVDLTHAPVPAVAMGALEISETDLLPTRVHPILGVAIDEYLDLSILRMAPGEFDGFRYRELIERGRSETEATTLANITKDRYYLPAGFASFAFNNSPLGELNRAMLTQQSGPLEYAMRGQPQAVATKALRGVTGFETAESQPTRQALVEEPKSAIPTTSPPDK